MKKYKLIIEPTVRVPNRISKGTAHVVNDAADRIIAGGIYASPTGLTASLVIQVLQDKGVAFRVEVTPLAIVVGPATVSYET